MSAGMFGSIFFLTLYVQQVLGASPLEAGLRTMPWTGTIMVVAPLAGFLAGKIGPRWIVVSGLGLQAIALLWIANIATTTTPYNSLLLPFVLGGVGMGLSYAPLAEAVMSTVRPSQQGQASGAHNSIRELGRCVWRCGPGRDLPTPGNHSRPVHGRFQSGALCRCRDCPGGRGGGHRTTRNATGAVTRGHHHPRRNRCLNSICLTGGRRHTDRLFCLVRNRPGPRGI